MLAPEHIRAWRADPPLFVRRVIGAEPEPWQAEALTALVDHPRLSIRSGHGVGKSTFLAWTILWWMCTRFPCKVLTTAPTAHQLFDLLWSELATWLARLPRELRAAFVLDKAMLAMKGREASSFAVARTARADVPEGLQGFHSPNMLVLVDEASGITDAVFQAILGALSTAGSRLVLAGNPTRRTGAFFASHHRARAQYWCRRVACSESSRVDKGFIAAIADEFGEDSDPYRVRVLGDFPRSDDVSFISSALVELAQTRPLTLDMGAPLVLGIDPADTGTDRFVIAVRRGFDARTGHWTVQRGQGLAAYLNAAVQCVQELRPTSVFVEGGGIGAGMIQGLRDRGVPVIPVVPGSAADEPQRFLNKRAECWHRLREALETGLCIPVDHAIGEPLAMDLTAPGYRWEPIGNRLVLESKDSMRSRQVASPDLADALALTFAYPVARPDMQALARRASAARSLNRSLI